MICAIDIVVAIGRIIQLLTDYSSLCDHSLKAYSVPEHHALFLAYESPFLQGMLHSLLLAILFLSGGLHYPTSFSSTRINSAIGIIILWYIFIVVANFIPAVSNNYMSEIFTQEDTNALFFLKVKRYQMVIQLTTTIIFICAPVVALFRAKCSPDLHIKDGPEGVTNNLASKNLEARLVYVLKVYLLLWVLSGFGVVLCFADPSLCSRADARGMVSDFLQVPTTVVGGVDAILLGGGLTSYRKRLSKLVRRLRMARRPKQERPKEPLDEAPAPSSAAGVDVEVEVVRLEDKGQSGNQDQKDGIKEPPEVTAFLKFIREW